ncbi:thioredoxin domain-containing protein [Noviherbaspirillum galbum]|uniref:Thioredoxin domain-containing protein n=1 Tax=Noviherbaspirillum galbum TaxID=2709383 RepID=A0A6B3SR44_9BURK|nr:thioredoxin domain-containing protein [Noviherbaspirillum galbum]NEX63400.1 thioredoxin domain-containing protein [Noviherbaspirillum galbum]
MDRRQFLLGGGALLSLPTLAQELALQPRAQGQNPTDHLRPYTEIGNYTDDRDRVFMFFSYACPYCEKYAPGIVEWGRTLPEPVQLVRVPLLTTERVSQSAASAFYVVREVAPQRIDEFDALAYAAASNAYTPEAFPDVLRKMKLPREAIQNALNKQVTKDRFARAILLSRRYKANVTPHFGIGGRYATNANFTNGDYSLLVQLLNGLVSQVITSA